MTLDLAAREAALARVRVCVAGGRAISYIDASAITRRWGFALGDVAAPVAMWQGGDDTNVPAQMAEHYAAEIPGAQLKIYPAKDR